MDSQECTSHSIRLDEITLDNNESDLEPKSQAEQAEYIRVENERNCNNSYEKVSKLLPKVNNSESNSAYSMFRGNTPQLTLRPKLTEWDFVTHKKLSKDVKPCPLHVDFKENVNLNRFYGFSNPEMDQRDVYANMLSLYNAWRTDYNDINGYNKVEERTNFVFNEHTQPEEIEEVQVKTPDINDSADFPTLGGRSTLPRSKASFSKQNIENLIDLEEIEAEPEPKDDPDEGDFVPITQHRKKKNKKLQYKKPTENIFDFQENATAWNSSSEVPDTSKRVEPKLIKPEPEVEETVACPICNKPFPMSQIENHASDCLLFEDTVQTR